jgi:two-component system, NtrC family, response regulator AtoC
LDDTWINNVKDPEMLKVLELAKNIAVRKATVLITGESGVGKELMARLIHTSSQRSQHPFVATNCAAVPENLLESELFGYEKGAFTGAQQTKLGKFEMADKGTFLLDEISELPLSLQGKLLRVLQESEIERLGGTNTKKIDVRFICTTNRDLREMVSKGEFRQDLFYRLNVIPLAIPSLQSRKKDLTSLVHFFLKKVSDENQMRIKSINVEAMQKLHEWSWPGNVRELQNVIERSCLMSMSETLSAEEIKIDAKQMRDETSVPTLVTTGMTIQEAEKRLILKTLEENGKNRTKAAQILGISIRTLRNKLNEYKLDKQVEF